jgi:hypothetical protein
MVRYRKKRLSVRQKPAMSGWNRATGGAPRRSICEALHGAGRIIRRFPQSLV